MLGGKALSSPQELADSKKLLKQAQNLKLQERYQEASKILQQIIVNHNKQHIPNIVRQAYDTLGSIYLDNNKIIEAKNIITNGLELWPNFKPLLVKQARLAQKQKKYSEAIIQWKEVQEKHPDTKAAYLQAGFCLIQLGKFEQAKALLKEAAEKWPNSPEFLIKVANVAKKQQQWSEELKQWQLIHKHFPERADAYIQRGNVLLKLGKVGKARSVFREAEKKWPDSPQPLQGLAAVEEYLQQWSKALECWERVIKKFPENLDARIQKGNILIELTEFDGAEDVFKAAANLWPDSPQPLQGLVRVATRFQQWPKALKLCNEIIKRFPQDLNARMQKGNILISFAEFDNAEDVFKAAANLWPNSPQPLEGLASIAKRRQHWLEALKLWEKVIEKFPENLNPRIQKGRTLIKLGEFDKAESVFKEAANLWPDSPLPLEGLVEMAQKQRDFLKVLGYLREINKRFPKRVSTLIKEIEVLTMLWELEQAQSIYSYVSKFTESTRLQLALSTFYYQKNELDKASEVLDDIIACHPLFYQALLKKEERAQCFAEAKEIERLINLLEKLHNNFPFSLPVKASLARIYVRGNRPLNACEVISSIPQKFDCNDNILKLRSWYYNYIGEYEQSKQCWQTIIQCSYLTQIHQPINTFVQLNEAKVDSIKGAVILFSCVWNEVLKLPWFLTYYRNLGVEHFVIIDNDSDDGTKEFLLEQDDVTVFWTNDSYDKFHCGICWLNELMERYGSGNWCIYVDIDELLVFPEIEKRGLVYLLDYMEKHQHEAMFAYMLDMYAENAQKQAEYKSGESFLNNSKYFSNTHHIYDDISAPYKQVYGGIRQDGLSITVPQTKTPIIKGGKGIKLLGSSHIITPAVVSDVTGVLLHFKLMGDFYARVSEEAKNSKNFIGGYYAKAYANSLEQLDTNHKYFNQNSIEYSSSTQLVELGLIEKPKRF